MKLWHALAYVMTRLGDWLFHRCPRCGGMRFPELVGQDHELEWLCMFCDIYLPSLDWPNVSPKEVTCAFCLEQFIPKRELDHFICPSCGEPPHWMDDCEP